MSGSGKTILVDKVFECLDKRYGKVNDVYRKVFISGTAVDKDYLYNMTAAQLGIISNENVSSQKSFKCSKRSVLDRFSSPWKNDHRCKRQPLTLMFIDEIDQGPANEIHLLMNMTGKQNCSLILIGGGNNVRFAHDLNSMNPPEIVVFREYTKEDLIAIFNARNIGGIFNHRAIDFIAMKLLRNITGGDVRIGLSIMQQCVDRSIKENKEKGDVEWKGICSIYLHHFNDSIILLFVYIEMLAGPLREIVSMEFALDTCTAIEFGTNNEHIKVAAVDRNARILLVGLIIFNVGFNEVVSQHAMHIAHLNFLTVIGMEYAAEEMDFSRTYRIIEALHSAGIISNGHSSSNGKRYVSLHNTDPRKPIMSVIINPRSVLSCPSLETILAKRLATYLEDQKAKN